jgi:polyisoprenoid-binding protein YceI
MGGTYRARLACACALLAALVLAGAAPARAAELFQLDQRFGSIRFSVRYAGLLHAGGSFTRFAGQLVIDPADPAATRIAVTVPADSITTPWAQETDMLRSADFFDVARYKEIRFQSEAVRVEGDGRYTVLGQLTMRDHTRPVRLHARLVRSARDAASGRQVEDFVVTGSVSRKAFGIVADPLFIADAVAITIQARILLPHPRAN